MRIKTEEEIRKELAGTFSEVRLDSEPFRAAYSAATDSHGPLVTIVCGAGGCGKSVLFRLIASRVRCLCAAPTGIAAMNVSGGGVEAKTIHALFHLPVGCRYPLEPHEYSLGLLKDYELLLVDEVSMVPSDIFDFLVYQCALSKTRVVFFGDPLQLPPVIRKDEYPSLYGGKGIFFHSVAFRLLERMGKAEIIRLTSVYRQKDGEFKDVLSEIRFGRYGQKEKNFLSRYVRPADPSLITLAFRNSTVREINERHLRKLFSEAEKMVMHENRKVEAIAEKFRVRSSLKWKSPEEFCADTATDDASASETGRRCTACMDEIRKYVTPEAEIISSCPAVRIRDAGSFEITGEHRFVAGERVMCTRNIYTPDGTSVAQNGSLGTVTGFAESVFMRKKRVELNPEGIFINPVPVVMLDNPKGKTVVMDYSGNPETREEEDAGDLSVPLVPAYAITYHKSQGLTLDGANLIVDEMITRTDNLFYLGLSRLRSAEGLRLSAVPDTISTAEESVRFVDS